MQQYESVSELTSVIRETLESNFDSLSVIGEISNFKQHVSGHWYFTLKDSNAQISCAMWKGFNNYVFFTPEDGMKIIVNGKISVYPPRGSYQIDVRSMKPAGVGELQAAFERLKSKLAAEGLFDEKFKKSIPSFPEKIGIITGSGSAAYNDIINIVSRRYPIVELVVAPTQVQGEGAAKLIAQAIQEFNNRIDIDILIIARGGGSLEDLWAFNEEIVARAVFESRIPVISGVGHEIDFTITDFVADLRAPTPSAAIELATPNKEDILDFLKDYSEQLDVTMINKIDESKDSVNEILRSYGFRSIENKVNIGMQSIDNLYSLISKSIFQKYRNKIQHLKYLEKSLDGYDIQKTLKKGFTLVKQNGKFVTRSIHFKDDIDFKLKFYDNEVDIKNG